MWEAKEPIRLHKVGASGEGDPSDEVCDYHIRHAPPGSSHMFQEPLHRANELTVRILERSVLDLCISSHSSGEAIPNQNVMNSLTILLSYLL